MPKSITKTPKQRVIAQLHKMGFTTPRLRNGLEKTRSWKPENEKLEYLEELLKRLQPVVVQQIAPPQSANWDNLSHDAAVLIQAQLPSSARLISRAFAREGLSQKHRNCVEYMNVTLPPHTFNAISMIFESGIVFTRDDRTRLREIARAMRDYAMEYYPNAVGPVTGPVTYLHETSNTYMTIDITISTNPSRDVHFYQHLEEFFYVINWCVPHLASFELIVRMRRSQWVQSSKLLKALLYASEFPFHRVTLSRFNMTTLDIRRLKDCKWNATLFHQCNIPSNL